jgi:hypothetical protein
MRSEKAPLVYVRMKRLPSGLIAASSDEVPGLHMAERSAADVERKAPIILQALMHEKGREVRAVAVESNRPDTYAWVLIPAMAAAL